VPLYRAPFFETLATHCAGGLYLFAGDPLRGEGIDPAQNLQQAHLARAENLNLFSPASPFYLCYQRGLLVWLEAANPDALIVEANPRYLSSPVAVRWMRARRRPVLGWGLGPPAGPWGFVRNLDGVIAYSARGAARYVAGGMDAKQVFCAPNAASPAPARPLPKRKSPLEAVPAADETESAPRLVILYVGRIQPRKRIPALLAACAALPAHLQPRLVIVGEGAERESLAALARKTYPLAVFTGALRGQALAEQFRAADLFVLPGTGGLAVQEAMSYGLPVIVAQGDGTQDDLVRPANGWQVTPNDDASLRETLHEALSDLARLQRMGAESYRIVRDEINLEQMAQKFVQALLAVQSKG